MGHVVLLGDSIFDNAAYVPGQPAVVQQVHRGLPPGWSVTLLAVDGHVVGDVKDQLKRMPADATHLFVSAGGNDALGLRGVLQAPARTVMSAVEALREVQLNFRAQYQEMIRVLANAARPTTLCTIYDAIPGLQPADQTALGIINDVILHAAIAAAWPVIDLRLVCDQPRDFSALSPIEPSAVGGAKIAGLIAAVATEHDFRRRQCVVYH